MKGFVVIGILILMYTTLFDACPHNCKCTKYKIFCRDSTIKSLPPGNSTTTLLSMENDMLTTMNKTVISESGLRKLTTLKLINMHITDIQSRSFVYLRKLKSLTINCNNITDLQSGAFLGLANLIKLDLSRNEIANLSSGVFDGLGGLRYLNLSHNLISEINFWTFAAFKQDCNSAVMKSLNSIDLSFNRIGKIHDEAFRGLCSLEFLIIRFFYDHQPISDSFNLSYAFSLRRLEIYEYWGSITTYALYNLRYLEIKSLHLPNLQNYFLEDSKLLKKLVIVDSELSSLFLEIRCFQGLKSLTELNLSKNDLQTLKPGLFRDLECLTKLDLSHNNLFIFDENSFMGLGQLRYLDLRQNDIRFTEADVFSKLPSLRELLVYGRNTESIGYYRGFRESVDFGYTTIYSAAFSGLSSLKKLQLPFIPRHDVINVTIESLYRLDSFEGPDFFLGNNFQVLKTLNLIISEDLKLSHIGKWLKHLMFLKQPVSLEIYNLKSLTNLKSLPSFPVSKLVIRNVEIGIIGNNSFIGFPQLRSLVINSIFEIKIEQEAFKNIKTLQYLKLNSYKGLQISRRVFHELGSLHKLVLVGPYVSRGEGDTFNGLTNLRELILQNQNIPSLGGGNFIYFEKLEKLDLIFNKITSLNMNAFKGLNNLRTLNLSYSNIRILGVAGFQGLENIETIDVQNNKIENIDAGVFGAICDGDFSLACPKLTRLSQFCNISTALGTLTRLYLSHNRITSIHEHAFLGCNKLQVLDLSYNKIQFLDFLYTPQLTGLQFSHNANVSKISNSTFRCTSKLTDIKFWSTNVKVVDSKTFKNLKHLKTVILPKTEFDCSLLEIWKWLNTRSIRLENSSNDTDFYLSNLKCSNSTSEDSIPNEYIYFITYIEPTVFIFIFVSGFLGNGFLLFIIFRHSDMRNKNNACIAHLAFADILCLILNLPLSYWDILHVKWDLGETACKMFIMSKDLTVALVACSVVALTFERYLVVRSFNNLKMKQGNSAGPEVFIGVIWIYALSTSIPSYFQSTVITRCYLSPPGSNDYVKIIWTSQLLLNSFFPILTIIFLNIVTAYTLKRSIRAVPGEIRNQQRHENRKTVANVVTVLSVVFTLSSLPNFLLRTLVSFSIWTFEDVLWYSFVTYCLFFSHAIFNPVSIFVMSSRYKTHIKQYLRNLMTENKPVSAPVEVNVELRNICVVLQELGQRVVGLQQEDNVDVLHIPETTRDEQVKRERQERLKKLQAKFL